MSDLFWLTEEQMVGLRPFLPKSYGKARVDNRRVPSGIIFINRNGSSRHDAPKEYGPNKTPYNRWTRWSHVGVIASIREGLASEHAKQKVIMIDATCI